MQAAMLDFPIMQATQCTSLKNEWKDISGQPILSSALHKCQ